MQWKNNFLVKSFVALNGWTLMELCGCRDEIKSISPTKSAPSELKRDAEEKFNKANYGNLIEWAFQDVCLYDDWGFISRCIRSN